PPHIRFYVQGDERTFWVFERANLWPADTKVERLVIPVQFREHKTKDGKDYSYYEVDKLVIENDSYTPVPEGWYTAYECDVWLTEHKKDEETTPGAPSISAMPHKRRRTPSRQHSSGKRAK